MLSQNNGEPSHQPQPTTSQLQYPRLGLGLGLADSFARASVEEVDDGEEEAPKEQDQTTETNEERAENERRVAAAKQARATITDAALAAKGIDWDIDYLFSDELEFLSPTKPISLCKSNIKMISKHHDFFSNMANTPELFMELAKHLRIKDLVSLYAISKDFHETIKGHLSHCMKGCAEYMASDSAKLFLFKFYGPLCVPDPAGRPHPLKDGEVRKVPGLKWLQMVVHREKAVRDILACMARQGHRMPKGMALSLKKMWLSKLSSGADILLLVDRVKSHSFSG
jgi:hypothetical protein